MPQNIDPASVRLNSSGHPLQFFADYFTVEPADLSAVCSLPPVVSLNITPTPLIPLNESCEFLFPDVIPLPPVYNPPNVKFTACENLSAISTVTTCKSAKNSYLTLSAVGPKGSSSGGPGFCGLTLGGLICIDACESFTAGSKITYKSTKQANALSGTLALTPTSIPNCGVQLTGELSVDACNNISQTNAFTISSSKAGVVTGNQLSITKATDGCGLNFAGGVVIAACPEVSVASTFEVTKKNNSSSGTLTLAQAADGCGITASGNINIDACGEVSSSTKVTTTTKGVNSSTVSLTAAKATNGCGIDLAGDFVIDACGANSITLDNLSTFDTKGSNKSTLTIGTAQVGDCGLSLSQDFVIDACGAKSITASSTVSMRSRNNNADGTISVEQSGDCGLALSGDLYVDACKAVWVTVADGQQSSAITITSSVTGASVGTLNILPNGSGLAAAPGGAENSDYACDTELSFNAPAQDVEWAICDKIDLYSEQGVTAALEFDFGAGGKSTVNLTGNITYSAGANACSKILKITLTPATNAISLPLKQQTITVCENGQSVSYTVLTL